MTSTALKAPRTLARCAQTAIGVAAVADVFRATALREHRLHPSDASSESGSASLVFVYLMTLAIVLFLAWLARARRNAESLSPSSPVPTAGWTIGAWFAPVANLYAPRQSVLDIGRASSPAWEQKRDVRLVTLWWAAWIGHGLAILTTTYVAQGSMALLVTAESLMIAAAVLLGLVIERITALQSAALRPTVPVEPLPLG
ncbi:DUF4328 domain-containing protein [Streptomyces sp. NBC_00659]|uniref:DUF4328 domain-containing protein n=1 Tax=Streptomyces sp. NBC_00659 TaxID=2903669 RepID=UPI002E32AB9A|nr:DUF4328 domain-containing protein [Streptomyces sp. NBC_00659]